MKRRNFLLGTSAASLLALGNVGSVRATVKQGPLQQLEDHIHQMMEKYHVPGAAACITNKSGVLWSKAYGWSDMESKRPMSLDSIQNIGSISKTFVATALMQLKEMGLLELDRNINDYLTLKIINPLHPSVPITTRQLMIHTSSLRDGSAYSKSYACGDPKMSIGTWVKEFFTPGGVYYNAEENFEKYAPGEQWHYSNTSFSVLGLIVESVSGLPFSEYCRRNIFAHLKMESTGWLLADIEQTRHSTPYSWIDNSEVTGGSWGGLPVGVVRPDGPTLDSKLDDGYHRNCLYNHPNYPDGFLRTSVNDLSRYMLAYLNGGIHEGRRILSDDTVAQMFTPQTLPPGEEKKRTFGLTWYVMQEFDNELAWGHGGGDPGVTTGIFVLPEHEIGAILFTNTYSRAPHNIMPKMLETAALL